MTKRSESFDAFIKFACPAKLRKEFFECCAYFEMSGATAFRLVMQEWIDLWKTRLETKKRKGS